MIMKRPYQIYLLKNKYMNIHYVIILVDCAGVNCTMLNTIKIKLESLKSNPLKS